LQNLVVLLKIKLILVVLILQLNVIVLAIILWAKGTEPRTHVGYLDIADFNHSFLVPPVLPVPAVSRQIVRALLSDSIFG
jgi:hypothetical protein